MARLLKYEDLSEWFGYKRPSDIIKQLQKLNVSYYLDKDKRPITTLEAINSQLIKKDSNDWEKGFS